MRRIKKYFLFLLLFCFCHKNLLAQNRHKGIDSLLTVLKTATEDTNKVNLLNDVIERVLLISGSVYYGEMLCADSALRLAKRLNFKKGEAAACYNIGVINFRNRNYEETLKNYLESLKISQEIGYKRGMAKSYTGLGRTLREPGKHLNYMEALKNLEAALKLWKELGDKKKIADHYSDIGTIYIALGDDEQVLKNLLSLLNYAKENGDKESAAYTYIEIGRLYNKRSNFSEALKNHQAALKIWEEMGYRPEIASSYHTLGSIYDVQGNYPEALKNYQGELKTKEEIGDKSGVGQVYHGLGLFHSKLGNYSEAVKNFLTAAKKREEIGDDETPYSYRFAGDIQFIQGNYSEALKNFQTALKMLEKSVSKSWIAVVLLDIGSIYEKQGNYPEALKNYQASQKIFEEGNDIHGRALSNNSIGNIHFLQSNYAEALKYFQTALKNFEKIKVKRGAAFTNNSIGNIHFLQGNYAEALKSFQAALKNFEEISLKHGIAIASISLGELYIQLDKPVEAKKWFDKALIFSKETGSKESTRDAYTGLAKLDSAIRNYQQALVHYRLASVYKDSLLNETNSKQVAQMQVQYESEKKDKEILQLNSEKIQKEKDLAEQKFKSEKELADKNAKHELELAEERLKKEKAIEIEKLNYQFALAEEKAEQDKLFAAEQFENERKLADENAKHQQSLADQKLQQEKKEALLIAGQQKQKAEQKRKTDLLMLGASMLIVILVLTFLYLRQRTLKQKALDRADAVHKMTELELQSLRAQLNPHFMFNSLNAIQDLILKEDNRNSHRYLSRFSKLLRMLLDNANHPFVSLKKEIDFLELYLSLENLRIPDLHHEIKVQPDIDTETTMIPNMMMQPYIENAIWHGLSHKTNDKKLEINIHKENGSVQCDIKDNGVGRKKSEELKSLYRKEHRSKGMELLSKRFNLLSKEYGTEIQTRVTDLVNNGDATGTLVEISVPVDLGKKVNEALYDSNYNN